MNLIRLLLLSIEGAEDVDLSEYADEQIGYHSQLLLEAGLVSGSDLTGLGEEYPRVHLESLTWEGHDFLDAARNESVWKKAMSKVSGLGGSFTFDVLKAVLIGIIKSELGI